MKNLLPRTKFTEEASAGEKPKWIVSLMMTIAVFYFSQIIESFLLLPFMIEPMFGYIKSMKTIDANKVFSLLSAKSFVIPDYIMLISLFLTIVPIVLSIVYITKSEKRCLVSIGFRKGAFWKEYPLGLLIGAGLFGLAWLICQLTGAVNTSLTKAFSWKNGLFIIAFFIGYMIQGLSEEVVCRGFLMQSLASRYPATVAITLNSLLFALLHILNPGMSFIAFLNLFLFGVFASIYMWKRGSIWGVAAIHTAWNFTQGSFLGVLVSGNMIGPSIFTTTRDQELTWVNGGAFGLEGGVVITGVLVLAILISLFVLPTKKEIQI